MSLENHRVKAYMLHGWLNSASYKWARTFALARGKVRYGRLGLILLTMEFGMLGYVLLPTTPAPRVAHVGKWGCTSQNSEEFGQDLSKPPHESPH
jgi:hypothetical protein